MLEVWKKKFTAAQWSMEYRRPTAFVLSQWQKSCKPTLVYLLYKWAVSVFFVVTWILSIIDIPHLDDPNFNNVKWLIYLTNWGFTMCMIQSLLGTAMVTVCYWDARQHSETPKSQDHKILQLYKIYWVINIIATDIAFGITIIYWSLLYKAGIVPLDAMNIIVHGCNSILVMIDLCLAMHPVRLIHFYWSVTFGAIYVLFSIIYYLAGGTNKSNEPAIYPILDWRKGGTTTLVCVLVCLFIVVLHIFTYCVYKLRKAIHKKWFGVKMEESSVENGTDNPIPVDLV